ncbi:MAG: alpha/beta hydrolase [Clostridiales bacterium]|nr:alpha/beta hydrolase [Clostridiales bacterium]
MAKTAKVLLKTALGAGAAYLAIGEIMYEAVLNKRFTKYKNDRRQVEEDLYQYYGSPEEQTDGDAWFVSMHPEDTALVNSQGKTMYSNIFMQKEYTNKWAVVIHGYTSCPRGMANQAFYFYKKGYNVLMPTLISFGVDPSKYCTMGYKDKDYVVEWIDYIVNMDENAEIAVLGVSMGSATTMLVTGEKLPDNVKCAVADCGYTSCWDEFCSECNEMFHLPSFPFVYAANTVSKLRGNFDFKKCSPVDAVARSKTPTLFIHGEKDTFVPYWMLDKVFNACTAEKEKLSVPDAYHAESCDVHPEIYYPAIDKFLDKYIQG